MANVRERILKAAMNIVLQGREEEYGGPEDSFNLIAKLWTIYKRGTMFSAHDVAMMMVLLKIARIILGRYKDDSYVDLVGYATWAAEYDQPPEKVGEINGTNTQM